MFTIFFINRYRLQLAFILPIISNVFLLQYRLRLSLLKKLERLFSRRFSSSSRPSSSYNSRKLNGLNRQTKNVSNCLTQAHSSNVLLGSSETIGKNEIDDCQVWEKRITVFIHSNI